MLVLEADAMAKFIPNYHSSTPISDQWQRHLQSQAYVGDITESIDQSIAAYNSRADSLEEAVRKGTDDITTSLSDMAADVSNTIVDSTVAQIDAGRRNAAAIVGAIADSTAAQIEAGHQYTAKITGTIEAGTVQLSAQLRRLGEAFDESLSILIDQHHVGNLLSRNIAELMRVPDFQKERIYYLEQGLKHYRNAAIDPSFMADALTNLLKAEEREPTDYVTAHRIGMVYLYSGSQLNLQKAEEYFLRAARYASVESDPAAVRIAQVLVGSLDRSLASQSPNPSAVRQLAVDALLQAGRACYLQGKYADALTHAKRAQTLDPSNILIRFNTAKLLAVSGKVVEAADILEMVVGQDKTYAVMTADDCDLAVHSPIIALLARLRREVASRLDETMHGIEASGAPFVQLNGELYNDFINSKKLRGTGDYLSLLSALELASRLFSRVAVWKRIVESLPVRDKFSNQRKTILSSRSWSNIRQVLSKLPTKVTRWALVERQSPRFPRACHPCFSPDSRSIVAGTPTGIVLWDVHSGRMTCSYDASTDAGKITFSPNGCFLAATCSGYVCIWNAESGDLVNKLGPHGKSIMGITFSPNSGQLLVDELESGHYGTHLRLYDVNDGRSIQSFFPKEQGRSLTYAFHPHSPHLIVQDHSFVNYEFQPLVAYKLETGYFDSDLSSRLAPLTKLLDLNVSPDGKYFCAVRGPHMEARVTLYDSTSLEKRQEILQDALASKKTIYSVAWSAASDQLAVTTEGSIEVAPVYGSFKPSSYKIAGLNIFSNVEFWPNGPVLRAQHRDEATKIWTFHFWNTETGQAVQELTAFWESAFAPSGELIACTSGGMPETNEVRLLDVNSDVSVDIDAFERRYPA